MRLRRVRVAMLTDRVLGSLAVMQRVFAMESVVRWTRRGAFTSAFADQSMTPAKPLFGNRCGKTAKSHWIVYMKDAVPAPLPPKEMT